MKLSACQAKLALSTVSLIFICLLLLMISVIEIYKDQNMIQSVLFWNIEIKSFEVLI